MIDIGKLYCSGTSSGDGLRYGRGTNTDSNSKLPYKIEKEASLRKPIVVWNVTKSCNLNCIHCYSDSTNIKYKGELSTEEGLRLIDDLSSFKIPSLLFSGGEPLMKKDIFRLIEKASQREIRAVLSTNGTLIDKETARILKDVGTVYVGISLDGMEEVNDQFRGMKGAFSKSMKGFENCIAVNQRVGLRLTLTKRNYKDLNRIFDFIKKEGINRACFYHLVYSGRGENISQEDLSYKETRNAMEIILSRTNDFFKNNLNINILTVDNHSDGVYIYLKLKNNNPNKAKEVYDLLQWNGGGAYSTGVGIGNIDFIGNVHPDQFWQDYTFGNVRERNFGDIWMDETDPLMHGLKHKANFIKGRCRLCQFKKLCTGSMRVRAYRLFGDPWAPDPQCYITDEEINLTEEKKKELKECRELFQSPKEFTQ